MATVMTGGEVTGQPTRRSANIDALRAVAALMVLTGHSYSLGGRAAPLEARTSVDRLLAFTPSGVWLFFAISGYVIGRPFVRALVAGGPLPGLRSYALRRGLRIYPLYWVTLTVVLAIVGVGVGGTHPWHLPVHYALLHNVVPGRQAAIFSVAWTLTLEVLFYVFVPVAAWLIRRRVSGPVAPVRLAGMIGVVWVSSIVWTGVVAPIDPYDTGLWLRGVFPSMLCMFCPGLLLAVAEHPLGRTRWRRVLVEWPSAPGAPLIAAGLIVLGMVGASAPLSDHSLVGFLWTADLSRQFFAVGYGILLAQALRRPAFTSALARGLAWIGLVSYGVYLIHAVLLHWFLSDAGERFVPMPHGGIGAFLVHLALLTGLTLPLAWLSWVWLERPLLRLAVRWGRRWEPTSESSPGAARSVAVGAESA